MSTAPGAEAVAGTHMAAEIAEQPSVFDRILSAGLPTILQVAKAIEARRPRAVMLAGRGTSDNAAYYAKYLVEVLQDFLEHGGRSCRVNRDADAFSRSLDALHGAREIVVALPMDQK